MIRLLFRPAIPKPIPTLSIPLNGKRQFCFFSNEEQFGFLAAPLTQKTRKPTSCKFYHLGLHESLKVLVRYPDEFRVGTGIEKDIILLHQMPVHIDLDSV